MYVCMYQCKSSRPLRHAYAYVFLKTRSQFCLSTCEEFEGSEA